MLNQFVTQIAMVMDYVQKETFVNVMKDLLVENVRENLDVQIIVMEKENVNKMKLANVIQDLLDLTVFKNLQNVQIIVLEREYVIEKREPVHVMMVLWEKIVLKFAEILKNKILVKNLKEEVIVIQKIAISLI